MGQEILGPLASLRQPDGLSDDQAERLEEAARHTRRLSIAGAKLGLARVPDGMLDPFLPAIGNVIRGDGGTSTRQRELLEQLRVVEIMFGSDTASKLFEDLRGLTSSRAAN